MRKTHWLADTEELVFGITLCGWELTSKEAAQYYRRAIKPKHVNCKRCLAKMEYEFGDAKHSTFGKRPTNK